MESLLKFLCVSLLLGVALAGRDYEYNENLVKDLLKGYDKGDYKEQFTKIHYEFPVNVTLTGSTDKEVTFKVEPRPYQSPGMDYNHRRYDIAEYKLKKVEKNGAKGLVFKVKFEHPDGPLKKVVTVAIPLFRAPENDNDISYDVGLKKAFDKFSKQRFEHYFGDIGQIFEDNMKQFTKHSFSVGRYKFIVQPEVIEESVFQRLNSFFSAPLPSFWESTGAPIKVG